jgi:hypothetical protein
MENKQEEQMIVCLAGVKRCGKDSVANILKTEGFEQISLADPLRNICSKVFDIPLDTFISDELKEKPFDRPIFLTADDIGHFQAIIENEWGFEVTESAHNRMKEHLDMGFNNPRHILQYIGTDLIRSSIDDNIFLKLADKRIEKSKKDIVISDCRFANERAWFLKKNAVLALVKRPSLKVNADMHISENDLGTEDDYQVIINNDTTLNNLSLNVTTWINMTNRRR